MRVTFKCEEMVDNRSYTLMKMSYPERFSPNGGIYTIEGDVVRVNSSCAEMADYRKLPVIEGTKSNIAGLAKAIMKR